MAPENLFKVCGHNVQSLDGLVAVSIEQYVTCIATTGLVGNTSTIVSLMLWASFTRLKRVFNIDIRQCPHCGERLRVIADITQPDVIHAILEHRTQHNPAAHTPRAPPAKASARTPSAGNRDSLSA